MLRHENGIAQHAVTVSTIVGARNGESGHVDGEGEATRFKKPCDIEGHSCIMPPRIVVVPARSAVLKYPDNCDVAAVIWHAASLVSRAKKL